MADIEFLKKKADDIRRLTLNTCINACTGHVTSSFSSAEILTSLYHGKIMRYDIKNPNWDGRDRFILSKGQGSPILYSVLADLGFFPKEWLNKFCCSDGKFGVHLQKDVPGVEITSGSLGQGFGVAVGIALAAKMDRKDFLTFSLLGDGECYEGSIWEAAMFAAHNRLNNLVAIIDRNWLCVTDFTENLVKLNPLDEKWRAFGWEVKVINGNDISQVLDALSEIRNRKRDKPYMIIAETTKGKGVSFMENKPLWHGLAPTGEEADCAKKEMKCEVYYA